MVYLVFRMNTSYFVKIELIIFTVDFFLVDEKRNQLKIK